MKIFIADTYEALSGKAAGDVAQLMQAAAHPVLCPASGDTPAGLYKALVGAVQRQKIDTAKWAFVGLDEWMGMNKTDEGSCRYHLNRQLFGPLQVREEQIYFFDGRAANPQQECHRIEASIRQLGSMEVAILGLGLNGHVGMNEPGTPAAMRTHVAALEPITQATGQKYFTAPQQLSGGITLGLGTIMEARHLMLLVSGRHKAGIVRRVLKEESSELLPASLLRRHGALTVYLDKEAAAQL